MLKKYNFILTILMCVAIFSRNLLAFDDVFFDDNEFVLTALFSDCALINEQWYCIGDNVLGYKLILVGDNSITLDNGENRFSTYIKKSSLNR